MCKIRRFGALKTNWEKSIEIMEFFFSFTCKTKSEMNEKKSLQVLVRALEFQIVSPIVSALVWFLIAQNDFFPPQVIIQFVIKYENMSPRISHV